LNKSKNDFLYSLNRHGIKVGLHRTKFLLKKCDNPHNKINFIHIAGTNGKGSTASLIANILKQNNLRVGLYTSPHLINFNERIRINGQTISDERINYFLREHSQNIKNLGSTFFETTTALMFNYFFEEKIDIGIIETGLGGRLDSTNVIKPLISVLTNIDFDHMELLGNSLDSITKEKCGIIKNNIPVVIQKQKKEVKNIIIQKCKTTNSKLIDSSEKYPISKITHNNFETSFNINKLKLKIGLMGNHQILNAQTAIATILEYDPTLNKKKIAQGLKSISWPGRLQKISTIPLILYDVGHNINSIRNTIKSIKKKFPEQKINGIFTLKKTKELNDIIKILKHNLKKIILINPPYETDFYSQNYLEKRFLKTNLRIILTKSLKTYFDSHKINSNEICLIFGSHYIAKEVFSYFNFPFEKGKI